MKVKSVQVRHKEGDTKSMIPGPKIYYFEFTSNPCRGPDLKTTRARDGKWLAWISSLLKQCHSLLLMSLKYTEDEWGLGWLISPFIRYLCSKMLEMALKKSKSDLLFFCAGANFWTSAQLHYPHENVCQFATMHRIISSNSVPLMWNGADSAPARAREH